MRVRHWVRLLAVVGVLTGLGGCYDPYAYPYAYPSGPYYGPYYGPYVAPVGFFGFFGPGYGGYYGRSFGGYYGGYRR
jgi:hypothetical protein